VTSARTLLDLGALREPWQLEARTLLDAHNLKNFCGGLGGAATVTVNDLFRSSNRQNESLCVHAQYNEHSGRKIEEPVCRKSNITNVTTRLPKVLL